MPPSAHRISGQGMTASVFVRDLFEHAWGSGTFAAQHEEKEGF
jgi:hypothetical protein